MVLDDIDLRRWVAANVSWQSSCPPIEPEDDDVDEEDLPPAKVFLNLLERIGDEDKEARQEAMRLLLQMQEEDPDFLETNKDLQGRPLIHQAMLRFSAHYSRVGFILKLLVLPVTTPHTEKQQPQQPQQEDIEQGSVDVVSVGEKRKAPPQGQPPPVRKRKKRRGSSNELEFNWENPRKDILLLQDREGKTPLMILSYAEWDHGTRISSKIQKILEIAGINLGLTIEDKRGWTAHAHSPTLFDDQQHQSDRITGLALEYPADLLTLDQRMRIVVRTLGHTSVWTVDDITPLLVVYGAKDEHTSEGRPKALLWRNPQVRGQTLLHHFLESYTGRLDEDEVLQWMVDADIASFGNVPDDDGWLPFHCAAANSMEAVQALRRACPNWDLNCRIVPPMNNNEEGSELLLRKDGRTPSHIAFEEWNTRLVGWLEKEGADHEIKDDWGRTPDHPKEEEEEEGE